jgi:hypothetical protein
MAIQNTWMGCVAQATYCTKADEEWSIVNDVIEVTVNKMGFSLLQLALFGFMNKLASQFDRPPLIHSYCYEFAGDRPTCLASLPLKSKSFMQYAG